MPGYLIDMDGVIYRGGEMIPGADRHPRRNSARVQNDFDPIRID